MCPRPDVAQELALRTLLTGRIASRHYIELEEHRREIRAAGFLNRACISDKEWEERQNVQSGNGGVADRPSDELPPDLLMDLDTPQARGVARLLASGCTDGEVMEMMDISRRCFELLREFIKARLEERLSH